MSERSNDITLVVAMLAAGSLAWAGVRNTFYWSDLRRQLCAVLLMQYIPFVDSDAMAVLHEFERGVSANVAS